MSTVFISYRRQTAAGEARALFSDLVARLGQSAVFMDVDSISLGRDFRSELQKTLAICDIMLVLIDKDWAAAKDERGRIRLKTAGDYVRMEIEAALKRDIAITPVLIKGAQVPAAEELPVEIRDLAYRNGFELSHSRWESDVREMIRRLGLDVPEQGGQVETDRQPIAPGEAGRGSVPAGAKPRVDREGPKQAAVDDWHRQESRPLSFVQGAAAEATSELGNNTIKVGGNATGTFVAGDKNWVQSAVTQPSLPDPSKVRIAEELAGLRAIFGQLNSVEAAKLGRALDDAEEEARKPTPDKNEVGSAVERALRIAGKASDFAENTSKLLPYVKGAVAWLGSNWIRLLPLIGL
jgi:hypothetical protein